MEGVLTFALALLQLVQAFCDTWVGARRFLTLAGLDGCGSMAPPASLLAADEG